MVDGRGLDILINNAGIYPSRDVDVTKEAAMRQFEVNAVGPLLVANVCFSVFFISHLDPVTQNE